jgi:hypothetical protein
MTKKNIQCIITGLGRMTALWAQGWHGIDGVASSRCHELGEDDGAADRGMARVTAVVGSGTTQGAQHRGLW